MVFLINFDRKAKLHVRMVLVPLNVRYVCSPLYTYTQETISWYTVWICPVLSAQFAAVNFFLKRKSSASSFKRAAVLHQSAHSFIIGWWGDLIACLKNYTNLISKWSWRHCIQVAQWATRSYTFPGEEMTCDGKWLLDSIQNTQMFIDPRKSNTREFDSPPYCSFLTSFLIFIWFHYYRQL